jgi:16S rRNA (cytidine1402-2'-O)-methyltransferase
MGDCSLDYVIPSQISSIISSINYFIVENIKTARRYIRKTDAQKNIDNITFYVLNKKTLPREIPDYLKPLREGNNMGVISEAGVPGVADPGALVVEIAHRENIQVVPLVGPSSIILALMASGLNGQNFSFHGYLPIKPQDRSRELKKLEKISKSENQTQIFMETPYRNNKLIETILSTCQANTLLCIASELTTPNEFIKTQTILEWKKNKPDLNKKPSIFLIHAH